jgi:hypothetical protein
MKEKANVKLIEKTEKNERTNETSNVKSNEKSENERQIQCKIE